MKQHLFNFKRAMPFTLSLSVLAMSGMILLPPAASAQQFVIKPVAEKKLQQLPAGPLFWRLENFPALAQAQAAAGPTGLAAEVGGKVWLFTLGQFMPGHGPDTPMEVFSAGTTDLDQLVMFVVDATKPFSSPAKMP